VLCWQDSTKRFKLLAKKSTLDANYQRAVEEADLELLHFQAMRDEARTQHNFHPPPYTRIKVNRLSHSYLRSLLKSGTGGDQCSCTIDTLPAPCHIETNCLNRYDTF
jgi:hypothetical protein